MPETKEWKRWMFAAILLFGSLCSYAQKNSKESLVQAIQQNDIPTFTRLLKEGANVNATDSNGATPLMWAAYTGNLAVFKSLMKQGADIKSRGIIYPDSSSKSYYGNLTGIAAAKNDTVLLAYCLGSMHLPVDDKEYNPESKLNDGWTALQWAASRGNTNAIQLLLKYKAIISYSKITDNGQPLVLASFSGQIRACLVLLYNSHLTSNDILVTKAYDSAYLYGNYNTATAINRWQRGYDEKQINLLLDSIDAMNYWGDMADSCKEKAKTDSAIIYRKLEEAYSKAIYGEHHPNYAVCLNNLGVLYEDSNSYDTAVLLYKKVLEIYTTSIGTNYPDYVMSLNNLAEFYEKLGNYKAALPLYEEVIEIRKNRAGELSTDYASSLNSLALIYKKTGNYGKALPLYQEALEIRERVLGQKHPDYAMSLNNLAIFYQDMGSYTEALPFLQKALEINRIVLGENHPNYAVSLNNLASLYQNMDNYEEALPLYRKALAIIENTGENTPDYATYLNNLAELYRRMHDYEEALPLFKKALEIRKTDKSHPEYATTLNNLALLYEQTNNCPEAIRLNKEALQIIKGALGETHPRYAYSLNNLARVYSKTGNYVEALISFQKSLSILFHHLQNGSSYLDEGLIMHFVNNNQADFEIANSIAIFIGDAILTTLSLQAELQLKGLALQNKKDLLAEIGKTTDTSLQQTIFHFKICRGRLAKAWQSNSPASNTDSLLQLLANDEQELIRRSPEYQQLVKNRNIQWQQIQQKLQPGEAAIEFTKFNYWNKKWTDTTLYAAFLLLPKGQPRMVKLCTQKQLEQLLNDSSEQPITQLYQSRGVQLLSRIANYSAPSLYQLLWKPLDSLLTSVHTIYYAPTGLLHRINPAAISYSGTKVLGDKFAFHLLGSTRDVVTYKPEYIRTATDTLLLYGGIAFNADSSTLAKEHHRFYTTPSDERYVATRSGGAANWPALEGTQDEVDEIKGLAAAQHFAARSFTGTAATEESFRYYTEQSSLPALIHIATHGFFFAGTQQRKLPNGEPTPYFMFSANAMLRSGLVFAGANRVSSSATPLQGLEDGIATAGDIANTSLQQTKLAVLSACETGLGKIENSEGVFGLQRAFRMAGCKNLIMSLWKVPDAQTAQFMRLFYNNLLVEKKSIYDSFQAAQNQMRTLFSGQPYFWAAFVLME